MERRDFRSGRGPGACQERRGGRESSGAQDEAMHALRQAAALDVRWRAEARTDDLLDPLRPRADFRDLVGPQ